MIVLFFFPYNSPQSHCYCVVHFKWDIRFCESHYVVNCKKIYAGHTQFHRSRFKFKSTKQQRIMTLFKYCLLFFDFKRSLSFSITDDLTLVILFVDEAKVVPSAFSDLLLYFPGVSFLYTSEIKIYI